jgi:hypothetical protein
MQGKDYINDQREMYKERNDFTNTDYYKIVSLSMKFYKQGAETGKDMYGNNLTDEEIKICEMLVKKMTVEIAEAEKNFMKEDEQ